MGDRTDENQDLGRQELDRLVRSHLPELFRFAHRLTGGADEAEEIVQEALLRVVSAWSRFRGDSAFRTWIYRIVVNVFRDRRGRKRLPGAGIENAADIADRRADDPARVAARRETEREIAERVSALPVRQRTVLVMMTYERFSVEEVSGILDMTAANVHATLYAARKRLRRELERHLRQEQEK